MRVNIKGLSKNPKTFKYIFLSFSITVFVDWNNVSVWLLAAIIHFFLSCSAGAE